MLLTVITFAFVVLMLHCLHLYDEPHIYIQVSATDSELHINLSLIIQFLMHDMQKIYHNENDELNY